MRTKKVKSAQDFDPSLLDTHASPSVECGDPSALAEAHELDERLREALDSLSDKHRTVFILHAMENLSYREIAVVMKSSIGTVMSRLFYARKKLQAALQKLGFEPPARRESRNLRSRREGGT
jgi:RNA polymerase sigma-70 factor (ECF subfamily)